MMKAIYAVEASATITQDLIVPAIYRNSRRVSPSHLLEVRICSNDLTAPVLLRVVTMPRSVGPEEYSKSDPRTLSHVLPAFPTSYRSRPRRFSYWLLLALAEADPH